MAERRARRRGGRAGRGPEVDLFAVLIDRLADDLCALPDDAWLEVDGGGGTHGVGPASLAERLAALHVVRTKQTEEE